MAPSGSAPRFTTFKATGDAAQRQRTWLWPKQFPTSGAVVVDGDSGVGKTRAMANWLRIAADKDQFPDGSYPDEPVRSIIHITGEMDDIQFRDIYVPQGFSDDWLEKNLIGVNTLKDAHGKEQPFNLDFEEHRKALMDLIKDFDANVVILDPFIEFIKGDENNTHVARAYLRTAQNMAIESNSLFILIVHWNKDEEKSARNRMSGSHQITATARARVTISHMKGNEGRRLWSLTKALEESQADLAFEIDVFGGVDWVYSPKPKLPQSSCNAWLLGRLADKSAHFIAELREEAKGQGFDEWQLKRAKEVIKDRIIPSWHQQGPVRREAWTLK